MLKGLLIVFCLTSLLTTIKSQPITDGVYFVRAILNDFVWDTFRLQNNIANTINFFGDEYQAFIFTALPNGFYTITSFAFGTNVAVAITPILEDTIFLALPNPDDISQQFRIIRRPSGFHMIQPRIDLSLAIQPSSIDRGEIFLNEKDCIGITQQFEIIPPPIFEDAIMSTLQRPRDE